MLPPSKPGIADYLAEQNPRGPGRATGEFSLGVMVGICVAVLALIFLGGGS